MKKSISILLSLLLVFGVFTPALAQETPAVVDSGFCGGEGDGTNLTWTLTSDNVITISGEGRMADYGEYLDLNGAHDIDWNVYEDYERVQGENPPWPWVSSLEDEIFAELGVANDSLSLMAATLNGTLRIEDYYALYRQYLDHPYTVVVEEGVTYVGANAFSGTRVTALSLPHSLEEIGYQAFEGLACESLTVPEGVRWLDPYAFCDGEYESVSLPSTLESVGTTAIWVIPGSKHVLHDITILSAHEALGDIERGIFVTSASAALPQLTAPEDYKTVQMLKHLLTDYYALYSFPENVSETLEALSLELDITPTEENRENLSNYLLRSMFFDLKDSYGIEARTAEEGMARICGKVNELLGLSLPGEALFLLNEGGITLSPAADAAFLARFGYAYSTLADDCTWFTLRDLKSGVQDYAPAKWITLRGRCGSAWESELGGMMRFEAVEHDLTDVQPTAQPTCTEPGEKSVVCPACGETFTETIPAIGHTVVWLDETPATATAHGHKAGSWCTVCETWISGGEVIHNQLGERVVVKEPTVEEEGEIIIFCTVCGESGLYALDRLPEGEEEESTPTFLERFRAFTKGIIDVLLRLIRWLGGNKG